MCEMKTNGCGVSQVPYYRGERITFDVAPSRMDFKVEHNSLKLEVSDSGSRLG